MAHTNSIKQNKINFSERISIVSGTVSVFAVVVEWAFAGRMGRMGSLTSIHKLSKTDS